MCFENIQKPNKKLIGYALVDPKFKRAAEALLTASDAILFDEDELIYNPAGYIFEPNSPMYHVFNDNQVMHWFKPVYKSLPEKEYGLDKFIDEVPTENWYINKDNPGMLVYHQHNGAGFGIDKKGKWSDIITMDLKPKTWFPAKHKIICERLIDVAKDKGINLGVYYSSDKSFSKAISYFLGLDDESLYMRLENGQCVEVLNTSNGQWNPPLNVQDKTWYRKYKSNTIFWHETDGCGTLINKDGHTQFPEDKPLSSFIKNPHQWQKIGNPHDYMMRMARERYPDLTIRVGKANADFSEFSVLNPTHGTEEYKIMVDGEWVKNPGKKPQLPIINGMKGRFDENKNLGEIVYGDCGRLRPEWFCSSSSREIKEMTLSSGVKIGEDQMNQIREFLINTPNFKRHLDAYRRATGDSIMMGRDDNK